MIAEALRLTRDLAYRLASPADALRRRLAGGLPCPRCGRAAMLRVGI